MSQFLFHLVKGDEVARLKQYIEANPHCLDYCEGRKTPLHTAAKRGRDSIVNVLVDANKRLLDARDNYSRTPLRMAVMGRHLSTVQLLVKRGCDISTKCKSCHPFHLAAYYGYDEIVEFLGWRNPFLLDSLNEYEESALHIAVRRGHLSVVELIVRLGSKYIREPESDSHYIMHCAVKHSRDMVAIFLRVGMSIDIRNNKGMSPMHTAIRKHNLDMIEFLHEQGSTGLENTSGTIGRLSPTMQTIELIVRLGAKISAQDVQDKRSSRYVPESMATLITLCTELLPPEIYTQLADEEIALLENEEFCLRRRENAYFSRSLVAQLLDMNDRMTRQRTLKTNIH